MKNKYITYMQKHILKLLLLLPFFLAIPKANASHLTGGDMSYECLGGGLYKLTFKVYRDCQGIPMCNCPGMAGCSLTGVTVTGVDPGCSNLPASVSMTIVPGGVSGFDVIQLCRTDKTICTNCGTRTPGTFIPGIEVYTFTGTINLNAVTPATCCNVVVGWSECCRNNAITNLQNPGGLSYFVGATINRCATPCSGAPTFTNDPVALVCAGQEFTYNLGAIDPEGDSLSYSFGSSQVGANTPAPYKVPYNATNFPFPYLGSPNPNLPPPLGINIDPVTGDVRFTPTGNFVSNFVIEVTQWRYLPGGAPYKVGITRRDIQFYSITSCPPNEPPKFITYNDNGELVSSTATIVPTPNPIPSNYVPRTSWSVCAKNQLCFIIEARDGVATTDTTDMTWNSPPTIVGSPNTIQWSWNPTYPRFTWPNSGDHIGVIKYDRWRFCWTPSVTAFNPNKRPYYFTVSARDRMCPVPARSSRSFAITVNQTPDAIIAVDSFKCGFYRLKYTLTPATSNVALNNSYTRWFVETVPGSGVYTQKTSDANNTARMSTTFTKGGKYNVYLRLSSQPPPIPNGCPNDSIPFTINVPNPVAVLPPSTYNCFGQPVKVLSNGQFGLPGANRFEYFQLIGANYVSIRPKSFDSTATLTPPISGTPPFNTAYRVVITEPTQGCTGTANFNILTRALPPRNLLPDIRICQSNDTTFWADGVNNTISANVSYKWYKVMSGDTVPFVPTKMANTFNSLGVVSKDSGDFVLIKTDAFGCKMWDSTRLNVNSFPIKGGSGQNACLNDPPLTMRAEVPAGATVSGIRWYNSIAPLITLSDKDTFQIPTNVLDSQRYVITSNTVFAGVGCPASDTITVVISPQPLLSPITPYSICNNVSSVTFPPINSINKTIKSVVWSYPARPLAINGKIFYVDSIMTPIPVPTASPYGDKVDLVAYDQHGCKVTSNLVIAIFPAPKVTVGPQKIICDYDKPFSLRPLSAKFNTQGAFPDRWSGRGVDSVANGLVLPLGTINEYFFNPQKANVRKANPKDTNIISYNFTRIYNNPLGYAVALPSSTGPTISGPSGGCPSGDTIIFEVVKTPKVDVSAGAQVCKSDLPFDLNVHFSAKTEALDPATSKWYFAPPNNKFKAIAVPDSNILDPGHPDIVVAAGAQATYKLYYVDKSTGCTAIDSTNLIVNGAPIVKLTLNDPTQDIVCSTVGKVLIDMQPSIGSLSTGDIGTYSGWDINNPTPPLLTALSLVNGQSQMQLDLNNSEIKDATYKFKYEYTNGIGCKNSDEVTVQVQGPPVVQIFDPFSTCSYDTVLTISTQNNTPFSPYTLEWNTNGTGVIVDDKAKSTNYTLTPDDVKNGAITFTVNTKAIAGNECPIATATSTVTINPQPKASFICESCNGCVNPKYNLVLSPVYRAGDPGLNNTQYFWYVDGNLDSTMNTNTDIFVSDSLSQTYTNAGKHSVYLKAVSDKGCVAVSSTQNVEAYPTPVPQFEPMPRVRTIANPYFNFNNSTSFATPLTYNWSLGIDPKTQKPRSSTEISPQSIKFAAELSAVQIILRATSDKGCIDSTSDSIRINPDITVFVPTVFSPSSTLNDPNCSGDCNRSFKVVADGFESIEIFVFNRWGQKVFETRDVNIGWNGTISNNNTEPCPQDAYIYQVNATSFSGKTYQYSGSITLLR